MQHTDIPIRSDISTLATARNPVSVSLYVPTSPQPLQSEAARIELRDLLDIAVEQLTTAGAAEADIVKVTQLVEDLLDDHTFWSLLARSLAVFVTPESIRTFRLPNSVLPVVDVSDRFAITPLLTAATFSRAAYILALSQNAVRLIEVTADTEAHSVAVPNLPHDMQSAIAHHAGGTKVPFLHIQGDVDQKVRLRQYCRAVDRVLRPVLTGSDIPLIIAAAEPLASIYRSVCGYAHLSPTVIPGNAEEVSDATLADKARAILDADHAVAIRELGLDLQSRAAHGRAVTDLSDVARAATYGAIDTLVVDIEQELPGFLDETSGAIVLDPEGDAANYGILEEIVRRALASGSRIVAVRAADVPGGGPVAATVRFAV
jgi:hypothetical protein